MTISTRKLVNRFYYPSLFAERHQRPLRVNRHRKGCASWRINVRWALEGEARDEFVSVITSYRNGIEHERHEVRKKCEPTLSTDFPDDVSLYAAVKGETGEVRCGFAEEGSTNYAIDWVSCVKKNDSQALTSGSNAKL